ncbi:MAG TPA: lipopolysaccharide assembly protein LapA domain-containing protein [Pseudonocardiaceae bacterium]
MPVPDAGTRAPATPREGLRRTRVSGTWVAVIVAAIVLIFLLVFILQNLTTVTVKFLGLSGSLPLGVAMLFAAIAGAILVALIGTARILQLRRLAKRLGPSR